MRALYSVAMTAFQVMLFLVGVHIFGFAAIGILLLPALRESPPEQDEDGDGSDDGWGNLPNVKPDPSRWPGGGIPLPDADQSGVRLREPGRVADRLGAPERRPSHEPAPRKPVRSDR
jgi:hypothetical protein